MTEIILLFIFLFYSLCIINIIVLYSYKKSSLGPLVRLLYRNNKAVMLVTKLVEDMRYNQGISFLSKVESMIIERRIRPRICKNKTSIKEKRMKGFHKNSHGTKNKVFILYISDHKLVTASNIRKNPIVSIFGMEYLQNRH